MNKFLSVLIIGLSFGAVAQTTDTVEGRIEMRLERLEQLVKVEKAHLYLPQQEQRQVLTQINQAIQTLRRQGPVPEPELSNLTCSKRSNGLYYPTDRTTFEIVGSTSYQAGHADFQSCEASLPGPYDTRACFKQSNGLFYTVDAKTGAILGSNSYQAGYATHQECKMTIPRPYAEYACAKQSNSLFYPVEAQNYTLVGSNSYQAGHAAIADCVRTLPVRNENLVCFKQSNSLYYPFNLMTRQIVGSTSYSAGYADHMSCAQIVRPRG